MNKYPLAKAHTKPTRFTQRSNRQLLKQFAPMDFPARRGFYETLTDDEKDSFYDYLTKSLIERVHPTDAGMIDSKRNSQRNRDRGYLCPDEVHRAENGCMWRSAAWYIIMGRDKEVWNNLPHMHAHFEALRSVKQI